MSVSCNCDFEGGIHSVGYPKEVTCRTARNCGCCKKPIAVGDRMYRWSMYDWDEMLASSPVFMCEECGDMAFNLMDLGYCFSLGSGIREQWLDYLHDFQPNNPAVIAEFQTRQ